MIDEIEYAEQKQEAYDPAAEMSHLDNENLRSSEDIIKDLTENMQAPES